MDTFRLRRMHSCNCVVFRSSIWAGAKKPFKVGITLIKQPYGLWVAKRYRTIEREC